MENEYVCQFCSRICKTKQSKGYHQNRCKQNPNRKIEKKPHKTEKKTTCPICRKDIRNCNFNKHFEKCKDISLRKKVEKVPRTGENAPFYRHTPWNKGLTKETDERIMKSSQKRKQFYKSHHGSFYGKSHKEETKKKISDSMTEYNHANQCRNLHSKGGWYNGIYFMSTWELAYYLYQVDNGQIIHRCYDRFEYLYNGSHHFYTPDFIVNGQYIEIKGREVPVDRIKYDSVQNLVVLRYCDIKDMIKYVKQKFGVNSICNLYNQG